MSHPFLHPSFVSSLFHIGEPIFVPEWGVYVLKRSYPNGCADATGVYPLTIFSASSDIDKGLIDLANSDLASIVLVTEPSTISKHSAQRLNFDFVRSYKTHYIFDRKLPTSVSKHHRYEVRRANRHVRTERLNLQDKLGEWTQLYTKLVTKHSLKGSIHDFPREHHVALTEIKVIEAIGAFVDEKLVSCHLWACNEEQAISYLAATSELGYEVGAAYAVNAASIEFLQEYRILNFGGGITERDNLARFKRGFTNSESTSLIMGKILNIEAYQKLCFDFGFIRGDAFFPAYANPKLK